MLTKLKHKYTPYQLNILATILMGANPVAIKVASEHINPLLLGGIRYFSFGLLIFFLYRHSVSKISFEHFDKLIVSSLFVVIFIIAFYHGIDQTSALKAGVISLTSPLWLYLLSIVFLKESFVRRGLYGSIIGLIGGLLLLGMPILKIGTFSGGDFLIFISALAMAADIAYTKYIYKFYSLEQSLAYRYLLAGCLAIIFSAVTGASNFIVDPSFATASAFLYLMIPGTAIGFYLYYDSLKKIRAEDAAPIFYLYPLVTVSVAALLLGESLSMSDYLATAIILIGVAIAHPHHTHRFYKFRVPQKRRIEVIFDYIRGLVLRAFHPIKW